MIESVSREMLTEDRIAICSHFGCGTIKKVKPLKFGSLGFRKYPKCSKHKLSLVFVEEFIEHFVTSVNSCLFDISSLPPIELVNSIVEDSPEDLEFFINVWMYTSPIGRGAQVVSRYLDGLSKGYIKLLSRKQKNAIQGGKKSKKSYNMLRRGLKKVAEEFTLFLQELRTRSHDYCDPSKIKPLSKPVLGIVRSWKNKRIAVKIDGFDISVLKKKYDEILNLRTASLILGESPKEKISAFELFSAYYEFTKDGLCNKLKKEAILDMQENSRIEKKKKKKLYVNKEEKLKECSHCGEILPFEEFSYIDDGRSKRLRHLCKNCRSLSNKKYFAVSKMKMKLYLLENLGSTCLCKKDLIEILPSVSFHHPTDKKTYTWSEGREQNEDQYIILKKLKSDGAIPLCANCHKLETASLFRKYKDLILTNNLFDKSTNNIINLIETTIKNETAIRKSHIRKHIKRWIRKRYIIEKLFEGKCQCCGNVDINNLPAFVMHHIGKHEDTSRWKDISDNDCEEIINTILKERIIFICSNCHRTIHSVFHKYVEEILEMYSEEYVEKIKKHITERYYKFKGLLDDYDYNFKESDIRSPLKVYIFSNQDSWKLYLIQLYYVMKKLQISSFRRDDFSHFFHINVRNVTNWIPVLLEMGFIKIEIPTLSQYHYYTFTQKGLKMIERIEIENKDETLREYKKIFSTNTDSIIRPLRYRVFMRVYNHPNITVGDLIRNDFINESEKSVRNYYYEARKYFPKK